MWEDSLRIKVTLRKGRLATESRMNVMRFSLAIAKTWEIDSLLVQRSKPLSFVARDPDVRVAASTWAAAFKKVGTCQVVRGKIPPMNRPQKSRPSPKSAIITLNFFVTRDIKKQRSIDRSDIKGSLGWKETFHGNVIIQTGNAQYFLNST